MAAVLIVERRGHPARESQWKYLWGHGILRAREENKEKNMNDSIVLDIRDLKSHFFTAKGEVPAVDGVSIEA